MSPQKTHFFLSRLVLEGPLGVQRVMLGLKGFLVQDPHGRMGPGILSPFTRTVGRKSLSDVGREPTIKRIIRAEQDVKVIGLSHTTVAPLPPYSDRWHRRPSGEPKSADRRVYRP